MKSVGEVMGLTFIQEALHKATIFRIKRNGFETRGRYTNYEQIIEKLTFASWDRVFFNL
jgi:carbamoyl-phosphate synthase large subunit